MSSSDFLKTQEVSLEFALKKNVRRLKYTLHTVFNPQN